LLHVIGLPHHGTTGAGCRKNSVHWTLGSGVKSITLPGVFPVKAALVLLQGTDRFRQIAQRGSRVCGQALIHGSEWVTCLQHPGSLQARLLAIGYQPPARAGASVMPAEHPRRESARLPLVSLPCLPRCAEAVICEKIRSSSCWRWTAKHSASARRLPHQPIDLSRAG